MTIQADEAASALKDAEAAAGRASAAYGYRIASGFLILWGLVWTADNVVSQISPRAGQVAWLVGAAVGIAGSALLGMRAGGRRSRGSAWKALVIGLAIGGFGAGVSLIAPPTSVAQSNAVAALAVGAVYMAMGVGGAAGLRLSAVGAGIMIATVAGWVFARDQFFLWMAVAGGGGLILGGLWLRKV